MQKIIQSTVNKKNIFLLAGALSLLLLSGCMVIPSPMGGGGVCLGVIPTIGSAEDAHGRPLKATNVIFIVTGKTTREEIIAKLGSEFRDSPRLAAMAYSWETGSTGFVAFSKIRSADERANRDWSRFMGGVHWRAFFIAFDGDGKVCDTKFASLSTGKSLDEQLEKWAQRRGAAAINTGRCMALK